MKSLFRQSKNHFVNPDLRKRSRGTGHCPPQRAMHELRRPQVVRGLARFAFQFERGLNLPADEAAGETRADRG